jgi:hypothetical protein
MRINFFLLSVLTSAQDLTKFYPKCNISRPNDRNMLDPTAWSSSWKVGASGSGLLRGKSPGLGTVWCRQCPVLSLAESRARDSASESID